MAQRLARLLHHAPRRSLCDLGRLGGLARFPVKRAETVTAGPKVRRIGTSSTKPDPAEARGQGLKSRRSKMGRDAAFRGGGLNRAEREAVLDAPLSVCQGGSRIPFVTR